ncbi:pyridoxal phosphate-dependent transferase [Trichoderma sp. SZMC 28012]
MSLLASLSEAPPDAAFALIEAYKVDNSPLKVDLSPGFYRDEDARPWILPSVRKAKQELLNDPTADHEHLPILGHAELLDSAQKLVFDTTPEDANTIASIQTIAGTGANHLGALFLAKTIRPRTVWISDPTWINHEEIWKLADPDIKRRKYPYFNKEILDLDFEGAMSTLSSMAGEGDVVILHGCAHNPTGRDFTKEQWRTIARICEQKRLIPFFDLAYQGFATGDLDEDAWPIRYFFRNTSLEMLVAQSFSKNFGLYGERIGVLHVVCRTDDTRTKVVNVLTRLSRAEITTCPITGSKIVAKVLGNKDLKAQWQHDLLHMSGRMRRMRQRLVDELRKRQTPGQWGHILTDIGMFSMTSLQPNQIRILREEYHVYLLPSGRISMTGLTEHNVEHVAEAFHKVMSDAAP